jgi:hypothetical protein
MTRVILILLLIAGCSHVVFAQADSGSHRFFGSNKFIITGDGEVVFVADSGNVNFTNVNFKPIFLWKLSDKLFVESEVEIETGDGFVDIGLEYINMCYAVNPYLTVHGGRFLPQFGMYRGRVGEAFINRFATDPVGFGDGGIGPSDEVGVGAQGGLPLGDAKMNYSVWVSIGPQLLTGADDPTEAGQFDYEAYTDNNKNKAIGGRIGFLPFTNSCLEVGFSDENAAKTGDQHSPLQNVGVNMMAIDANFFHKIPAIKSTLRLLGEWRAQNVDKANYPVAGDTTGEETFTFDNNSSAWYATASLRPSSVNNKFLRNLEVAFRYSEFQRPKDAPWGGSNLTQTAIALNYWLKWNCVAKIMWQNQSDASGQFLMQLVYGF